MVGVDGSSPFAPTKIGRKIKHLAFITVNAKCFFLGGTEKVRKSCWRHKASALPQTDIFWVEIIGGSRAETPRVLLLPSPGGL
jgi:hypothetical protein